MDQNYKILISYDGTDYHGWQRQPNKRTIQGVLEDILFRFRSQKINVIGAGRTDAGVHALGQVAHFKADLGLNEQELHRAINSQLPHDIRILSLDPVPQNFHARKSAKSKIYAYRIHNSAFISPFDFRYMLHWPSFLDLAKMKQAAALFIREADFSAFSSNRLRNPIRQVQVSQIEKHQDEIMYTVQASGFLQYMVRTMVGTLLEIGRGKQEPILIEQLFEQKKRSRVAPTAPARGLCLMQVIY